MIFRDIEGVVVEPLTIIQGAGGKRKSHIKKNPVGFTNKTGDWMKMPFLSHFSLWLLHREIIATCSVFCYNFAQ